MVRRIEIFDTTLRDGEQSPGVSLNVQEKLEVARQLARLKVDAVEAGFPIASDGDFRAVQTIAREVEGPAIVGLCRTLQRDIDRAWEAIEPSAKPRIHTFIATSDIHMEHKLKKSRSEVLRDAVSAVEYARSFTDDVEFSPEDAGRTDPEFLFEVLEAVIAAGATVVNIPDTVGYSTPEEFGGLIKKIVDQVPNIGEAKISVHCHNDLGLAVANSLAAVKAGAVQVEGAVNGIGERAGNAALEEVIMALRTRRDFFDLETGIETTEIYKTSRLVSTLTGMKIQPNKAIVGENAFAHEAGIHQDGVIKERTTYEIMDGRSIGLKENRLVLGKHSGRHAFRKRLEEMGYELDGDQLNEIFKKFKNLADRKKGLTDRDIEALIEEELFSIPATYELEYMHVCSGASRNHILPTATLRIRREDEIFEEAACGEGPVDAVYRAIDRITGIAYQLESYDLKAITGGRDALGEVTVRIRAEDPEEVPGDELYIGHGVSTDIIEASALAYLNAVNKSFYKNGSCENT